MKIILSISNLPRLTLTCHYEVPIGSAVVDRGTPAVIHRLGDLNGTTTVGVYVIPDDNMVFSDSLVGGYYIPTLSYMTWIGGNSYFNVTFDPGVSERTIYIDAWGVHQYYPEGISTDAAGDFHGSVKLDIVEVDDGYNSRERPYIHAECVSTPTCQFR